MKVGGQILWNAIPISETFKIYCLMGRHHAKGGSENHLTDQLSRLERWSNITLFLPNTCRDCISSARKSCQVYSLDMSSGIWYEMGWNSLTPCSQMKHPLFFPPDSRIACVGLLVRANPGPGTCLFGQTLTSPQFWQCPQTVLVYTVLVNVMSPEQISVETRIYWFSSAKREREGERSVLHLTWTKMEKSLVVVVVSSTCWRGQSNGQNTIVFTREGCQRRFFMSRRSFLQCSPFERLVILSIQSWKRHLLLRLPWASRRSDVSQANCLSQEVRESMDIVWRGNHSRSHELHGTQYRAHTQNKHLPTKRDPRGCLLGHPRKLDFRVDSRPSVAY